MKTTNTFLASLSLVSAMVLGSLGWPQGRAAAAERDPAQSEGQDVYVAGRVKSMPIQGNWVATVWKNGVPQYLSDPSDPLSVESTARSVFVSGGDVYVAGSDRNAAVLWKNGSPQRLSSGNRRAFAASVFVAGNDVYVAGGERDPKGIWYAMLWKNGKAQALSRPAAAQYQNDRMREAINRVNAVAVGATYVFVSGDDVYVAGFERSSLGQTVATLWVNGKAQVLGGGTASAAAESVFVEGENVYAAVNDNNFSSANIWKNGQRKRLGGPGTNAMVHSVFASGPDVYVAGEEENPSRFRGSIATLWKNGEAIRLGASGSQTSAKSIFLLGGDVYVAGELTNEKGTNIAVLWKNGEMQNVSDGKFDAQVNCVFVK